MSATALVGSLLLFAPAPAFAADPQSWSTPAGISLPGETARNAQIMVASDGAITLLWQSTAGSDNTIQTSSSFDNGVTWTAATVISASGVPSYASRLAIAPDDTLIASWFRTDGSFYIGQTSTSTDHGATWSAPVDLSDPAGIGGTPTIAFAPDNTVTAIWEQSFGGYWVTQISTSTNRGTTWSTPSNLTSSSESASASQLAVAPDGTITALWSGSSGTGWNLQSSISVDHGANWTAPTSIPGSGSGDGVSHLVMAPDGFLTVIWNSYNGSNWVVNVSGSSDHGATWSTAVVISATNLSVDGSQLAVADDGTLTSMWSGYDGTSWNMYASTSADGGATWSLPVVVSAVGVDSMGPKLAIAPNGNVTAVWVAYGDGSWTIQASTSSDNGATWSTVTNVSPSGPRGEYPQLAAASDGSIFTVWQSSDGVDSVIQVSIGLALPPVAPGPDGGALAVTGADSMASFALAGLFVLLIGTGLVVSARVRRREIGYFCRTT